MKCIEKKKSIIDTDDYVRKFNYRGITKEEAQIALRYAKAKYDLLVHDMEYLDNKADLLIKYLGLVVGGLGAINGYLGLSTCSHFSWTAIVGISVGILAMSLALWVRKPADVPYAMTVQTLFKIIKEKRGDQIPETALALAYEKVLVRLKELGKLKGYMLWIGYILIIISIALLFFSLIFRVG
jgi:hypothetical protein